MNRAWTVLHLIPHGAFWKGVEAMAKSEPGAPQPAAETELVTSCGRVLAVKCLRLVTPGQSFSRVTLDLGPDHGGVPGAWAALTSREARELARRLLAQASLAERDMGEAADALPSASSGFPPA
jgi:hypothetical protein